MAVLPGKEGTNPERAAAPLAKPARVYRGIQMTETAASAGNVRAHR